MRKRVLAALLTGALVVGSIMPAAAAPVGETLRPQGDMVELIHVTLPGESKPTVFEVINGNYPDIPGMERIPGTSQYVELSPIDESDPDLIPFEELMAEAALYNGEPTEAELSEADQELDILEVDGDVSFIQSDDIILTDDDILEMEEDAADSYIDPEYLIDKSKYNIGYYDEGEDPEEKAREAAKQNIADHGADEPNLAVLEADEEELIALEADEPDFEEIQEDDEDPDFIRADEEDAHALAEDDDIILADDEDIIEISGDDDDIIVIEDDDQDIVEADEEVFDADETVGTPTAKLKKTSYPYPSDGKLIEPAVEVKDGTQTVDPKYYSIYYPSSLRIGNNRVSITFYGGTWDTNPYYGKPQINLEYIIQPPKPTISSVKEDKTTLDITVTLKPFKGDGVRNFYVEYADNKSFKNAARQTGYLNDSVLSATIQSKDLFRGKTYYFRAATYYTKWNDATSKNDTFPSNWTAAKTFKTSGKYIIKDSAVRFMNWKDLKSIKSSYKKSLPASVKKLETNQMANVYYANGKPDYFIVYTNYYTWAKGYDKGKESYVESFDTKGKRTGKVVLTKDADGNIYNYSDQFYTENKVVYPMEIISKDGKVARRNYYNANKKKLVRYTTYKYKTTSSGRTEEECFYDGKGKLERKSVKYYDKADFRYGVKYYNEKSAFTNGTWYTKSRVYKGYYYDSIYYHFNKKNYTKTSQYDTVAANVLIKRDGATAYRVNFTFDKNGKETTRTYSMEENISNPSEYRYLYYDSKKKVSNHSEFFNHIDNVRIYSYYR